MEPIPSASFIRGLEPLPGMRQAAPNGGPRRAPQPEPAKEWSGLRQLPVSPPCRMHRHCMHAPDATLDLPFIIIIVQKPVSSCACGPHAGSDTDCLSGAPGQAAGPEEDQADHPLARWGPPNVLAVHKSCTGIADWPLFMHLCKRPNCMCAWRARRMAHPASCVQCWVAQGRACRFVSGAQARRGWARAQRQTPSLQSASRPSRRCRATPPRRRRAPLQSPIMLRQCWGKGAAPSLRSAPALLRGCCIALLPCYADDESCALRRLRASRQASR